MHGVAMDAGQAASFAGLVWCPASNYFLLGNTAAIDVLAGKLNIVFGTDSTLTAPWQTEAHFKTALRSGKINEAGLLNMLTASPAKLWKMKDRGMIAEGMRADILVKENSDSVFGNFQNEMLLLIKGGEIMLSAASVPVTIEAAYDRIEAGGQVYYVKKGIVELANSIRKYYPELQMPFSPD